MALAAQRTVIVNGQGEEVTDNDGYLKTHTIQKDTDDGIAWKTYTSLNKTATIGTTVVPAATITGGTHVILGFAVVHIGDGPNTEAVAHLREAATLDNWNDEVFIDEIESANSAAYDRWWGNPRTLEIDHKVHIRQGAWTAVYIYYI